MGASGIHLVRIPKSNHMLREWMARHYSAPKGFVGRSLIYLVVGNYRTYGAIVAGSATRFLPGREAFFGASLPLNNIVNNTFFHIEKVDGRYPYRNFVPKVLREWRLRVGAAWCEEYGDEVLGWESLVELPRTGDAYDRDGWTNVGTTHGYTCKRTAGKGTDSWSGRRAWNTDPTQLRPKHVFVRQATEN